MNKEAADVLGAVPTLLRKLAEDNRALRAQVQQYERQGRAHALLQKMESRGMTGAIEGESAQAKVASLLGRTDLDILDQAVDLVPATGGMFELGEAAAPFSAGDRMESYLLGNTE